MLGKLEKFQQQLDVLRPLEPGLRNQQFQPSGNVFVTFTSETAALSFRTKHLEGRIKGKLYGMDDLSDNLMQNGVGSWDCQLAPMPAEIYWENLGLSKAERLLNEATGAALTGAVFMLFIGIACVAVFFISWDYFYYLYGLSATPGVQRLVASVKDSMTPFAFYVFGIGGFGGGLLVFEEFMSEIIEHFTGHERPVTQSRKQVSYSKKCYWFYIIFHLVLSTVAFYVMVVYFLETTVPIRLYVDMCGLFHMNRALLTCAVVDPFHMLEGIGKFRRASKVQTDEERCAKTSAEDEEDMLYHADHEAEHDEFFSDHFDYSKNYGETIAIFSTASYYATMHPLIMFCASVYFYVKYVIDKYQVRPFTPPLRHQRTRSWSSTAVTASSCTQHGWMRRGFLRLSTGDEAILKGADPVRRAVPRHHPSPVQRRRCGPGTQASCPAAALNLSDACSAIEWFFDGVSLWCRRRLGMSSIGTFVSRIEGWASACGAPSSLRSSSGRRTRKASGCCLRGSVGR
eukprot:COSAG05_NODE_1218_length_5483_cov_330.229569_1_plen_513_part_00